MPIRSHLHHKTPGWVKEGGLFHVRIRTAPEQSTPLTNPAIAKVVLAAAADYHLRGKWWCELMLLMPDHLHALVSFPRDPGMTATIKNWKRAIARIHEVKWQSNFFDHRVRNLKEGNETRHYILNNPVMKKLCGSERDWPHWWSGTITDA